MIQLDLALLEYVNAIREDFAEIDVVDQEQIFNAIKEDLIDRLEFIMENK